MRFALITLAPVALAALIPAAPALAAKAESNAEMRMAVAREARTADAGEKKERRICKREQRTGSNMPGRKICLTASAWRNRPGESW